MSPFASRLRATGRILTFAWVLLTEAILLAGCRGSLPARARWLQRTCRRSLRALGVRIHPLGEAPAGAIIVSNHVSYLDILVLAAIRPVVFVAKGEVRGWPVFGWFARCAGTRFIDRERRGDVARVVAEFAPAVSAGLGIVVFLEGTSTDGKVVRPFRSSLLSSAVAERWPVAPVALAYALPAGHDVATEVCWWGDMTLTPHLLHLFTLPRIDASVAWGEVVTAAGDRKELAATLHAHVTRLLALAAGAA